jgi:hypothetical protein
VQVTGAAQPFEFQASEADWISGGYAMSNGWRLKVDPSDNGIVAQIDKRPPTLLLDPAQGIDTVAQINGRPIKLVAVSRDRYVSSDGNMALEFNRGSQGDEMLMSYAPDAGTAQVVVVSSTARLAQR